MEEGKGIEQTHTHTHTHTKHIDTDSRVVIAGGKEEWVVSGQRGGMAI